MFEEILRLENCGLFSKTWYLEKYPDVAQSGMCAATHYLLHGASELRDPGPLFSTRTYISLVSDLHGLNPVIHYLDHGIKTGLKFSEPKPNVYTNLEEFLVASYVDPIMPAPFNENDKRVLATMDSLAYHLSSVGLAEDRHLVSVIIPVHNRQDLILNALSSVTDQSYKNIEIIVIDDGSSDSTVERVLNLRDERIKLHQLPRNQGASIARNKGLEYAKGEYITYLDSDNIWLPEYIAGVVGAFRLNNEASAIYTGQFIVKSDLTDISYARFGAYNKSLLQNRNYIDINCFAHRREIFFEIGGFNNDLRRLVDWEYILRIAQRYTIVSIPIIQSIYYEARACNTITALEPLEPPKRAINSLLASFNIKRSLDCRLDRKIAIIIPSYESLVKLQECIESLKYLLSNSNVQIIVVDNYSSQAVHDYLSSLDVKNFTVLFNGENYGFSYAVNQGVALAHPDADIFLLNNDAAVRRGALEALHHAAYESSDIAITVPQQLVEGDHPDLRTHVPYASSERCCDVSASRHHGNVRSVDVFHNGKTLDLTFAPFFCVYIKRTEWNACNGLDHLRGRHYRSDRIMCNYIISVLKKRIVFVSAAQVVHSVQHSTSELKQRSDTPAYDEMVSRNAWPKSLSDRLHLPRVIWDVK